MQPNKIERKVTTRIPTELGEFQLMLYANDRDGKEHLALVQGEVADRSNVLVRVHSECFTGDVLGSQRCDCGEQLQRSLQKIAEHRRGVLIYLRQEGRGIGLLDKLRAYNLQDQGYDTVEANLLLGHQADERDYSVAACILEDLRVCSVRLLTNNPEKIQHLKKLGVDVSERIPLEGTVNAENADYLRTKAQRMHHMLSLGSLPVTIASRRNGTRPNLAG
ncbi:MAG: GTP cyclohydrolase II [Anaerolineales bacterium]|jgi:GTP cyclohydrolase II